MSKEKLSTAEVQLLLNHYQRRLKKAGKKIASLEKKQAKLRGKIEKLFLLQSEKNDDSAKPAEVVVVPVVREEPAEVKQPKKSETVKEEMVAPTPKVVAKEVKKAPKPAEEEEETTSESAASGIKRPTSPGQWNEYVINVIARNRRPTLTREIYESARVDFSFSEEEMLMEERSIAKSLNVLSAKTGDLQKFKEGKMRGFYYCLPQWFYPSGELKKMYYSRIPRNAED